MKIQALSDLHLELETGESRTALEYELRECIVKADAEVVVLAGDIGRGAEGVVWAATLARPVLYVLGNHEYYQGGVFAPPGASQASGTLAACRAAAAGSEVRVLERERVEIDGVRFLGCSLWTDFRLLGDGTDEESDSPDVWSTGIDFQQATDRAGGREAGTIPASRRYRRALSRSRAMHEAHRCMSDYRQIRVADGDGESRRLTPADTAADHDRSRAWLERMLREPHPGPVVVVTHHAPSIRSLTYGAHASRDDPLAPAYASNLETLMGGAGVPLWIHGHTHWPIRYYVGATRVVSNPRGYPRYEQVPGFRPGWVLEV